MTPGDSFGVSQDGKWCGYLAPGSFVVRVAVPETAKGSGLSFAPYDRKINVVDVPLSGLDFVQFKAVVSGKVSCALSGKEGCSGVVVHLK